MLHTYPTSGFHFQHISNFSISNSKTIVIRSARSVETTILRNTVTHLEKPLADIPSENIKQFLMAMQTRSATSSLFIWKPLPKQVAKIKEK